MIQYRYRLLLRTAKCRGIECHARRKSTPFQTRIQHGIVYRANYSSRYAYGNAKGWCVVSVFSIGNVHPYIQGRYAVNIDDYVRAL